MTSPTETALTLVVVKFLAIIGSALVSVLLLALFGAKRLSGPLRKESPRPRMPAREPMHLVTSIHCSSLQRLPPARTATLDSTTQRTRRLRSLVEKQFVVQATGPSQIRSQPDSQ